MLVTDVDIPCEDVVDAPLDAVPEAKGEPVAVLSEDGVLLVRMVDDAGGRVVTIVAAVVEVGEEAVVEAVFFVFVVDLDVVRVVVIVVPAD